MNLSEHFTLEQLTKNQIAIRLGIDNTPGQTELTALTVLCDKILEPIYDKFGPIFIAAGFMSMSLARELGESARSQLIQGEAVEIDVLGVSAYDLAAWIKNNLIFDQLILKYYKSNVPGSGWVHISYQTSRTNRNNVLTATKFHSRTSYEVGLIE